MKADIWEGGHRIPFVVRWPGKIMPNSKNDQLTSLTNFISTAAELTNTSLNDGEGKDSRSILPVLLGGEIDNSILVIHHSSKGMFSIRVGNWKYIDGLGSGGFSQPALITPEDGDPTGQLFNLSDDPGEENDVYMTFPEKVKELKLKLDDTRRMK
jgi:arylsulfatase A-like enzyme